MNPEDNQSTPEPTTPGAAEPTPVGLTESAPAEPVAQEEPAAPEAPSLDQVAADLAANPEAAAEPIAEPTPVVEPAPTLGATPMAEPTLAAEPTLSSELSSEPTPVSASAPEQPTMATEPAPAPSLATPTPAVEPTSEPTSEDPAPETPKAETSNLDTEPSSLSSASFIGDAPEPPKTDTSSDEEEEPLQPANPVPGSIGSALVYSETAPDHAMPVSELKKRNKINLGLSKNNVRTMLIIVAAVALVAALVVVLIFIFGGSGSKKNTSTNTNTTPTVTTPVVSSLTCTKEGAGDLFTGYGDTTYGEENIIAMYTDDELTSLGSTASLEYGSVEAADAGLSIARGEYTSKLESLGILSDPFNSSYDVNNTSLTVTHQADAEDITSKSGKIFGLMTVRGEVVTDIETLKDSYEEDGYKCVAK